LEKIFLTLFLIKHWC